jgi:sigma-B regulation protein RsbU (phosphoserine phosphatase)
MATPIPLAERPRLLIADDQQDIRDALRLALREENFLVEVAGSPAAVLEAIRKQRFDAALLDLNYARDTTSGGEGIELLEQVRQIDEQLPIVVMTAWGSVELAVEAMQRGAGDFVQKPWDNTTLRRILRTQIARGTARRAVVSRAQAHEREHEREWAEAQSAQQALLPRALPALPGMELAAVCRPARELAGDYYDIRPMSGGRVLLCIGDVAGKGTAAALVMANLQAAVKALAEEDLAPIELCRRVNRVLCGNCEDGRFVTFFCSVLDTNDRTLRYVNAGHNPPIVARPNGSMLRLGDGGPVLGEFPDWSAAQGEIQLGVGDRIVLYTDGITEAANIVGDEYGAERLGALACAYRHETATELHSRVMADAIRFAGGVFSDDATLLVMAAI